MSEFPNEPMSSSSNSELSLIDTWMIAFTKPNEGTFVQIAAQRSATAAKAILWVFVASLVTSFVTLVAQSFNAGRGLGALKQFLPPEIAQNFPLQATPSFGFGTVICGAPVGAIFAVLGFVIIVALVQWVAKLFGGTGSFDKLAYSFSAITVPYSVVSAILTLLGIIPLVGILTGLISFVLSIYVLVLEVLAIKAVNGVNTGKAIGALILPGLVFALLICCCIVIGALLLGPTIGGVFSQIQQGIY